MAKFIFCFLLILFSCSKQQKTKIVNTENEISSPVYTLEVSEYQNGWGYSIFENSKPMIIQKHIPSVQGVKGFENKEKATKCGRYIIFKLQNGLFPPSITKHELDSLEVI